MLRPTGAVVSSASPFVNIPNYPNLEEILATIRKFARHVLVDTRALAKQAGNGRAENTVMLGAASAFLPLPAEAVRAEIGAAFAGKGDALVAANARAFDLGREAALARHA